MALVLEILAVPRWFFGCDGQPDWLYDQGDSPANVPLDRLMTPEEAKAGILALRELEQPSPMHTYSIEASKLAAERAPMPRVGQRLYLLLGEAAFTGPGHKGRDMDQSQ